MKSQHIVGVLLWQAILCSAIVFPIAAVPPVSALAQTPKNAKQMTDRIASMMQKVPDGGPTGEQVGWQWNYYLGPLLEQCRETPNDEWMLPTERILNTMFDKMSDGPDGYKGFIGPYIYNAESWCDVHVSDAILCAHALEFAMIVHDQPRLRDQYKNSVQRFIAIAQKDLIEKWRARKTYVEDGPFAGYREGTLFCKPNDTKNWFEKETARSNDAPAPSLPFNKSLDMGHCMLQLYYLTGEVAYKEQAEKIFNRVKAGMNRFDGAYTWNYWEPLSPKDIIEKSPGRFELAHWVGTHPYRNYQASEVEKIVFAYDMGVTFTEDDIRRLVKTNLMFMWNGDRSAPSWNNSDSRLPGYVKAASSKAYPTTAGAVWPALARFDETIGSLHGGQHSPSALSWERRYAPRAQIDDFPWMHGVGESGGQTAAVVIPSLVPPGEKTLIFSKASAKRAPLEIYVRPADGGSANGGKMVLLTTQQLGDGVPMFYSWDGTIEGKRTPGDYVIIWKYLGGQRAYPVTLQ